MCVCLGTRDANTRPPSTIRVQCRLVVNADIDVVWGGGYQSRFLCIRSVDVSDRSAMRYKAGWSLTGRIRVLDPHSGVRVRSSACTTANCLL